MHICNHWIITGPNVSWIDKSRINFLYVIDSGTIVSEFGRENCIFFELEYPEFLLQEKVSLENRKLRKRTGFYEGDESLTWTTTTVELMVLMIQFLI